MPEHREAFNNAEAYVKLFHIPFPALLRCCATPKNFQMYFMLGHFGQALVQSRRGISKVDAQRVLLYSVPFPWKIIIVRYEMVT